VVEVLLKALMEDFASRRERRDAGSRRQGKWKTDMVYKPEHVSDLEGGAIVRVEVRNGDAGDTEGMSERVMDALQLVAEALPEEKHGQIADQQGEREALKWAETHNGPVPR
jgi:hypothetical protein